MLPCGCDFGEGNVHGIDLKLAARGVGKYSLQGIGQNIAGRNAGGSKNRQSGTAQHGSGQRDRGTSAFSYLNQASLGFYRRKALACHCGKQHFGRLAPQIVDDNLETGFAGFPRKSFLKLFLRKVEADRRIGPS